MLTKQLLDIINAGEGLTIEYKKCHSRINRDVYETVCAFLNRQGGHLVMGVSDNGAIVGIAPEALADIKKDLVTTLNNFVYPKAEHVFGKPYIHVFKIE